jgi:hypothetical protein
MSNEIQTICTVHTQTIKMDWVLIVAYSLNKSPMQSTSASSPVLQEVSGTNPKDAAKGVAVVFAGMHTLVLISGVHTTMRPRLRALKTCYVILST